MGRRPEPKSDKIARGTYRADRDKSMTVALADEAPPMPGGLGEAGKQFWSDAYAQSWVAASDRTMVLLVAWKLDERQLVAAQNHQSSVDESRKHRTLKEMDRDIASGLDQLLLTPNSRKKAGIETADASKGEPSKLDLLLAFKHGDITAEEYDRRMEPERERRAADLKKQGQREQLERISQANTNRIEALLNPDGLQPKLDDQD
jgi:hypothetical protein